METSAERWERLHAAGEWLRTTREQRGYPTAAEFARALGWERQLLSNYETGKTVVPDDRAQAIADTLGLDIITTRAGLGLWVPDQTHRATPDTPDLTAVSSKILYAELMRRAEAGEVTRSSRKAAGM